MSTDHWTNQVACAVTVTEADGTITEMNPVSIATFANYGGAALIGSDVFACHPEPSRMQLESMFKTRQANHYTIRKNGQRKIIHQLPLMKDGVFQGYVEISIPIPDDLPHFERD